MKNADDASESHRPVRRVRRNREKVVGHVLAFRAPELIPDPRGSGIRTQNNFLSRLTPLLRSSLYVSPPRGRKQYQHDDYGNDHGRRCRSDLQCGVWRAKRPRHRVQEVEHTNNDSEPDAPPS